MPNTVVLAESYGSVLADTKVPCVIVQFHGFANSTEFKHIMETGLSHYTAHSRPEKPWGWVGDVRQMGAIPQAVQEWLTSDWNPRAFAAGIREISIVLSENALGQVATQQYVQKTVARQDQYEIEPAYYPSLAKAKEGAAARCAAQRT
jgi:hypothetical protein